MTTKSLTRSALFIALLAISAFIKIPLGSLPMTLQTLVVLLIGLVLPTKEALMSILGYILAGLIGIPVFTSGGGIGYIFYPSFGFILGFLGAVLFLRLTIKNKNRLFCIIIAILIIYLVGIPYFVLIQYTVYGLTFSLSYIITSLFLVFLPGEIISCLVALWLPKRLQKFIKE